MEPQTLGEHLRKKRLELGLLQRDVAARFGVTDPAISLWEKGHAAPEPKYYPAIFEFLGYDPFPEPQTLGERVKRHRLKLGLTQERAAMLAGVSVPTFARWESGEEPTQRRRELERFLRFQPREREYKRAQTLKSSNCMMHIALGNTETKL